MEPHLCVGIDVGCRAHRVGIAHPNGSILEEFDISSALRRMQDTMIVTADEDKGYSLTDVVFSRWLATA